MCVKSPSFDVASVVCSDRGVSEISPLAHLTKLESLNLKDTGTSDVGSLAGLTNLKHPQLDQTLVDDIGPLANLVKLESLSIKGTQVKNYGGNRNLVELRELHIPFSAANLDVLHPSSVRDRHSPVIEIVAELPSLERLSVLEEPDDFSIFSKMRRLESLKLSLCDALVGQDLEILSKLRRLRVLDLSETQVTDIRPLSRLKELKHLELGYSGRSLVRSLRPLSKIRGLSHLRIGRQSNSSSADYPSTIPATIWFAILLVAAGCAIDSRRNAPLVSFVSMMLKLKKCVLVQVVCGRLL